MDIQLARFKLGDVVKHRYQGYRAVVIDIDPLFQGNSKLHPNLIKRPFAKVSPWYRVLIEGGAHVSYVEETLLDACDNESPLENPSLSQYLIEKNGCYKRKDLGLH